MTTFIKIVTFASLIASLFISVAVIILVGAFLRDLAMAAAGKTTRPLFGSKSA